MKKREIYHKSKKVNCHNCNKEIFKKYSEYIRSKYHYCCNNCRYKKSLYRKITKYCIICNKEIIISPSENKKYKTCGQFECKSKYFSKENHPLWKGGITKSRPEWTHQIYKNWRKNIFNRDKYTCQKCHKTCCKLNAHHILSWKKYPEKRYDLDNGISLCLECHKLEHKIRTK